MHHTLDVYKFACVSHTTIGYNFMPKGGPIYAPIILPP